MSEQNKGKTKSSMSTVIATAIVALAAVAAIIVLIVMTKNSGSEGNPSSGGGTSVEYKDTQEFADECGKNAQELVAGNYRVVRLFISEGLPHKDEPYGNRPESGYYTAVSDEFKTYADLESYVKSVFTEKEANRILTKMPLDPAAAFGAQGDPNARTVALYWSRSDYVDVTEDSNDNTSKVPGVVVPSENSEVESTTDSPAYVKQDVLGINASFKPYTDYKKPWGSISIKILPVSEEECDITIYLGADKDVDLSSVEETDILTTKMVKENGEWRLTALVF